MVSAARISSPVTASAQRPTAEIIDFEPHQRRQSITHAQPDEIVCFPLTVDESLSADAQHIVKHSCGDCFSSLRVEPLARKHQSILWISIHAAAYGMALHAIILGLPSAELGKVTHIPTASYNERNMV